MPAVEVQNLRKEFRRSDGKRSGLRRRRERVERCAASASTSRAASASPSSGQNGSGKSTLVRLLSTLLLHDGGSARVFGHDVVREARAVRRLVNRVSVEASFFKKMSATENLSYAARFYGLTLGRRATGSRRSSTRVGFPADRARRADGGPLARHAAEGRARARAPDLAGAAAARRADDGPRPALEARGAGLHPRDARDARHDDPALHARPGRGRGARRPRRHPRRRATCSCSSPPTSCKAPLRRRRRSRRRSSPRPARRSRTRSRGEDER